MNYEFILMGLFVVASILVGGIIVWFAVELWYFIISEASSKYRQYQYRRKTKAKKSISVDEIMQLNKKAKSDQLNHWGIDGSNMAVGNIMILFGSGEERYIHHFKDDVHKYVHDGRYVYEIVEIDMDHTIDKKFYLRRVCDYYGLLFEKGE